jgi:hypothetical protein
MTRECCACVASEPRDEAAATPRVSVYAVPSFGEWSEVRERRVVAGRRSVTPQTKDKKDTRGALKNREMDGRDFQVRLTLLGRVVDA